MNEEQSADFPRKIWIGWTFSEPPTSRGSWHDEKIFHNDVSYTRTDIVEAMIAELEARIAELEAETLAIITEYDRIKPDLLQLRQEIDDNPLLDNKSAKRMLEIVDRMLDSIGVSEGAT